MFLWLGTAKRTRRVKGGRKQRAFCPECREETTFVEVEVEEKLQLFAIVDLLEDKSRALRCVECDSIGQLVDSDDLAPGAIEDLSPEAAERLERSRSAERLAQARAERERRERERIEREVKAEQNLVALKKRMGLPPAADAENRSADEAPDKRPWWRVWRQ